MISNIHFVCRYDFAFINSLSPYSIYHFGIDIYWHGTFTLSAGMMLLLSTWFLFSQLYSYTIYHFGIDIYWYRTFYFSAGMILLLSTWFVLCSVSYTATLFTTGWKTSEKPVSYFQRFFTCISHVKTCEINFQKHVKFAISHLSEHVKKIHMFPQRTCEKIHRFLDSFSTVKIHMFLWFNMEHLPKFTCFWNFTEKSHVSQVSLTTIKIPMFFLI